MFPIPGHPPHPSDGRSLRTALAAVVSEPPLVLSALDEPLLQRFGGQRIAEIVRHMGLRADEAVEHPLVTQALTNARERVGREVRAPREARSVEDWLARNLS